MKKTSADKPASIPENLVLTGMFGGDRSAIGRLLAQKLRYSFVDVDRLIEAKYKKPLHKVLESLGLKRFMKMEEETILALHYWHCVIVSGESAVYYPTAMKHLKTLGPRIYLKADLEDLRRLMPDGSNRGVACRGGNTLSQLLRERSPLYRKYADFTIKTHGKSNEAIVREILINLGWDQKVSPPEPKIRKTLPSP
jgi:shikimate kinase